jgi:hypothetical protein
MPTHRRNNSATLPDELQSSRVYLADFDRITYSQVAWTSEDVDQLILDYERKIKLLLLVKGHIIIPLSHLLESDLAREILRPFPDLFASGAIVPMLTSDASSAQDFLQKQLETLRESDAEFFQGSEPKEMAGLIDQTAKFVRWNDEEASQWFCERMLDDLENPQSLLRLTFQRNGFKLPKKTRQRLAKISNFNRNDVYFAAKALAHPRWGLISEYADFLNYLSEAITIKSEGILPQENLLDFSLSDLAGGQTHLSEFEVFTKLFIDTVKAITSAHFPVDFLDTLSIPDALELHEIAVQSEFIKKYHSIQEMTKACLEILDPERLVLTFTELEFYERELHQQFHAALDQELPFHLRERKAMSVMEILHTVATLVIPFYGNIDAAKDIIVSGMSFVGREDIARKISKRVSSRVGATEQFVDRRKLEDQPIFLDFVDKLKSRYIDYLSYPD